MEREPRTIYLIRHGKTQLPDNERRYIGHFDVPLDEAGVEQARCLRQRFDGVHITAAYCSDLLRSRQTTEIVVKNTLIPIYTRQDLREIHLGEWEGCTFTGIGQRFPDEFRERGADIVHYRVPGGESFDDCHKRVLTAFYDILKVSTGSILITGHAGVNRMILCHIMGLPLQDLFKIRQEYSCMNIIQQSFSGLQVVMVNNDDESSRVMPLGRVADKANGF
jgi:alpha-ribazole phosphatase